MTQDFNNFRRSIALINSSNVQNPPDGVLFSEDRRVVPARGRPAVLPTTLCPLRLSRPLWSDLPCGAASPARHHGPSPGKSCSLSLHRQGALSTRGLIDRLHCEPVLRHLYGREMIRRLPSEATFSRVLAEFALETPDRGRRSPTAGHKHEGGRGRSRCALEVPRKGNPMHSLHGLKPAQRSHPPVSTIEVKGRVVLPRAAPVAYRGDNRVTKSAEVARTDLNRLTMGRPDNVVTRRKDPA